jgi:hypothetical protein
VKPFFKAAENDSYRILVIGVLVELESNTSRVERCVMPAWGVSVFGVEITWNVVYSALGSGGNYFYVEGTQAAA